MTRKASMLLLLLASSLLGGCTSPSSSYLVSPDVGGCPQEWPAEWKPGQGHATTVRDLMTIQVCGQGADNIGTRVRHPASAGLSNLIHDLQEYVSDSSLQVEVQWFDEWDTRVPGAAPVPPLDFADLEGVNLPVIRFGLPARGTEPTFLITTNIEAPETANPWLANAGEVAAAADLSASGLAASLAALLQASANRTFGHGIDLLAFSGELGYRGWIGTSFNPYVDQNLEQVERYAAVLNVQNVGHCGFVSRPSIVESKTPSNAAIREFLKPIAANNGVNLSNQTLFGRTTEYGEWGMYVNPAKNLAFLGIPGTSIDGGWWSRDGPEGGVEDTLRTICWPALEQFAAFLVRVFPLLPAMPHERIPECARAFAQGCDN